MEKPCSEWGKAARRRWVFPKSSAYSTRRKTGESEQWWVGPLSLRRGLHISPQGGGYIMEKLSVVYWWRNGLISIGCR